MFDHSVLDKIHEFSSPGNLLFYACFFDFWSNDPM